MNRLLLITAILTATTIPTRATADQRCYVMTGNARETQYNGTFRFVLQPTTCQPASTGYGWRQVTSGYVSKNGLPPPYALWITGPSSTTYLDDCRSAEYVGEDTSSGTPIVIENIPFVGSGDICHSTPFFSTTVAPQPGPTIISGFGSPVVSGSTCGATNQYTPSCTYSTAPDRAYAWTAPFSGSFTFTTTGSNYDTALHVYDAASNAALGCNDDSGGTLQSSVVLPLRAGQQVTIVVDGYGSSCGNFSLNISGVQGVTKNAMTWSLLGSASKAPSNYVLVGSDSTTNAIQGDTPNTQALPVLCINKNGLANPGTAVIGSPFRSSGGAWLNTWAGGLVALTPPVLGTSLTSQNVADNWCMYQFGTGYRMAEFHDGDPSYSPVGWDFWAEARGDNLSPFQNIRFWVRINDQNANPW